MNLLECEPLDPSAAVVTEPVRDTTADRARGRAATKCSGTGHGVGVWLLTGLAMRAEEGRSLRLHHPTHRRVALHARLPFAAIDARVGLEFAGAAVGIA